MIDLDKPITRKIKIMNHEYVLTFNRLGIIFREKGSRDTGKLLEWDRALMMLNGMCSKDFKSNIKTHKDGTTAVSRSLI